MITKNFNKLLEEFEKLYLDKDSYALFGSAILAVRGIRDVHDLDVFVTKEVYKIFKEKYPNDIIFEPYERIEIGHIEIKNKWSCGCCSDRVEEIVKRSEFIGNHRYVKICDWKEWKENINREKDKKDLLLAKEKELF